MRSVFVFPRSDIERTKERLTRPSAQQQPGQWLFDAGEPSQGTAIYAYIVTTSDASSPLFCGWDPSDVRALEAALGHRPEWCVTCDISGRVPGDAETRALVSELLADGGVVMDDYSDHPWTLEDIKADRVVDGLRFFDYRGSYERDRAG